MKTLARNVLILIFPFLVMILINEIVRPTIKEKPYEAFGVTTINSAQYLPEKCTWACHNSTEYCKQHHVKYLKPYYQKTDVLYFGLIGALKATGNYGAANILFLVLLFPLTILYFFIKSLNIQDEITRLSK
ncbi:hypothetical protein C7N43_29865 [Sphingobacteriales bacterium UPWRP_1]|nr:hypothetical protein B6N25_12600 [Sphingobacteriales bacterium TSM_CSS]PSJ73307.1 hypothetical protein C7N43_29865 [Sphingobacteriales bacterium UPWRP_1]